MCEATIKLTILLLG